MFFSSRLSNDYILNFFIISAGILAGCGVLLILVGFNAKKHEEYEKTIKTYEVSYFSGKSRIIKTRKYLHISRRGCIYSHDGINYGCGVEYISKIKEGKAPEKPSSFKK